MGQVAFCDIASTTEWDSLCFDTFSATGITYKKLFRESDLLGAFNIDVQSEYRTKRLR